MAGQGKKGERATIVIRREEVVEGGHHGGAWKVAYADFVTAMMAFFLLMWLLNATTEAQRKGLADYFTPSNQLSHSSSGSGQPFGGHTPFDHGQLVSDLGVESVHPGREPPPPAAVTAASGTGAGPAVGRPAAATPLATKPPISAPPPSAAALRAAEAARAAAERARQEHVAFTRAAAQIRDAVRRDPALAELRDQLAVDEVPAGLRIQLLDSDHNSMFATGSARMNETTRRLLGLIAPLLARLPQPITISGHTDAAPYKAESAASGGAVSNWSLSSGRADATRRLLVADGVQTARILAVTGKADRDLLLPADPLAAANRRISILVLRSATPPPAR